MTLEEIKKQLYKQNVFANFTSARKEHLYYEAVLNPLDIILFKVPFSDMGDAIFHASMPAKLLNRYIVMPETQPEP